MMDLSPLGYIELSKKTEEKFKNKLYRELSLLNKSLDSKALSDAQRKVIEWEKRIREKELKEIDCSPDHSSLLVSGLILISFYLLKDIAEDNGNINESVRLSHHKSLHRISLKCAKILAEELLKRNQKQFKNIELYFKVLNYLKDSKKISKEDYDYRFMYHPGVWIYNGIGFDGSHVDNLGYLVSERVKSALQNSDYYLGTDEEFKKRKSDLLSSVYQRVFDTYIRDLGISIQNDKEWELPIDDWQFGRNLIDMIIHKLDESLCSNAFNPFLTYSSKKKQNLVEQKKLAQKVRSVVKKFGKDKFQKINGKSVRTKKLIDLLRTEYGDELIDSMTEKQRQTTGRYATADWIGKEVNSRDLK